MKIKRKFLKKSILVDTTPMTDIVFLLLIFFMLSSSFLIEPGIKLKLPKTQTAEIQAEKKLTVSINRNSKIFLNDREIKLEELEDELRVQLALEKERLLIIRADKEVSHGLVVDIMDIAKLAGADKLAIATEKK